MLFLLALHQAALEEVKGKERKMFKGLAKCESPECIDDIWKERGTTELSVFTSQSVQFHLAAKEEDSKKRKNKFILLTLSST